MSSNVADAEPGITGELVNLNNVPLSVLRNMDGTAIRRALHHLDERTGQPSKTETQCSSLTRF